MSVSPPARAVVVWCDLGPQIGVGHLMRCLALAEEVARRGREVVFLADASSVPFARDQLAARGFRSVPPPATEAEQLALVASLAPEAVVVDSYRLPPSTYAALHASYRTLAIVDGEIGEREADVYLDQNIGSEDDPRALPAGAADAVRLAGLRYSLMRRDILRRRPDDPDAHAEATPLRVLAFFGGTDAFGAAPVATAALIGTGKPFALTVVAAGETSRAALEALQPGPGQQIDVISPTDRIAEMVTAADLVVSAAGTSSWELLCLGAAVAFVCVADNQEESYGRIAAQELCFPLGKLSAMRADPTAATEVLRTALTDAGARSALRRRGWELVDGAGGARVADRLLGPDALI